MAKQDQVFKNQTFRLKAPTANKVLLVGDFTSWQKQAIPMQRGSDGIWRTSVGLAMGTHQYLFLVDGQWRDDPECPLRVSNPHGGQNMVRQVV
ncbi:MAG: glycogen-binding domain-containing protein [Verrucomicrobiota bacterium]|jgi:1,4-alpha-glucan branching enzyme